MRSPIALCLILFATPLLADPVNELPLQRGYYVDASVPCGEADNSTLYLVTREGINSAPATCVISQINQTGPTRFEVTDNCTELASGAELGEATATYDIPDDHTYGFVDGETVVFQSRFCAQADLPEPYRSNDISDLVN